MKSIFRFDPVLVARGTEEFWVPAVLAAVSAGGQYVNQQNATSRQNSDEIQAIANQQAIQQKANGQVKQLTNQIAQDSPSQLAAQATGQYVSQLRKNAAGTQTGNGNNSSILFGQPTSSLPTNIKANSRYNSDTATSQNQTQQYGSELAGEMGQIDAATRLRQNEGLAQQTLGTNLNLLGAQSATQNFVDQLRSSAAGQQSPWLALLSSAAGGAANTLSKNMGPSTANTTIPAGTVLGDGSIGGNLGGGLPGSASTVPAAPSLYSAWSQ